MCDYTLFKNFLPLSIRIKKSDKGTKSLPLSEPHSKFAIQLDEIGELNSMDNI